MKYWSYICMTMYIHGWLTQAPELSEDEIIASLENLELIFSAFELTKNALNFDLKI